MSEWEAGAELDAAIAQHVFGLVVYEGLCFHPDNPETMSEIPPYSSDIAAAWTVLEVVTDPKWIGNNTPSQWVRDTPPSRLVSYLVGQEPSLGLQRRAGREAHLPSRAVGLWRESWRISHGSPAPAAALIPQAAPWSARTAVVRSGSPVAVPLAKAYSSEAARSLPWR